MGVDIGMVAFGGFMFVFRYMVLADAQMMERRRIASALGFAAAVTSGLVVIRLPSEPLAEVLAVGGVAAGLIAWLASRARSRGE